MMAYLLMFVYAWGGTDTDDGLETPLVPDRSGSIAPSDATVRVNGLDSSIIRNISFSSRRDGRQESQDVYTTVRTVSVA